MLFEPEPNTEAGQPITLDYLDRRRRSMEAFSRVGWQPGLLPGVAEGTSFELCVEAGDTIRLSRLRALGEHGYPLLVGEPHVSVEDPVFDASGLPVGRNALYACLRHEKRRTGEILEFRPAGRSNGVRRMPRDLVPEVVLEVDRARLSHRDWLQIASFERARDGHGLHTLVDPAFHPPVRDLSAYPSRINSLPRFGRTALEAVARLQAGRDRDEAEHELRLLLSVACCGDPQIAFLQAVRCLDVLRRLRGLRPPVEEELVNLAYSPRTMWRFLDRVQRWVEGRDRPSPYPDTLEIDGVRHLRADGEFEPVENYWVWRPPREPFVASGIALYLPAENVSTLPIVGYGQVPPTDDGQLPMAEPASELSHPGAALRLAPAESRVDALYLFAKAQREAYNLGLKLGSGHGIYYY